jgi:hypothetical protein
LAIGLGLGLLLVVFVVFAALSGRDQSNRAAADLASDDGWEAPEAEKNWLAAVGSAQDAAEDANEVVVVQARKLRAEQMCAALPEDLRVHDWLGEVEAVETTSGGDGGVLSITVAKDVLVQTWNNGLSDIGDDTLIDPDTSLYTALATLHEGDQVTFSGSFLADDDGCVSESSLFDTNGVRTPSFMMKFESVSRTSD